MAFDNDIPRLLALAGAVLLFSACGATGHASKSVHRGYATDEPVAERSIAMDGMTSDVDTRLPAAIAVGTWQNDAPPAKASITDFDVEAAEGEVGARPPGQRLLIYSGSFSVAVANVQEAADAARRMATELGGWFQSQKNDVVTIRVPASRWEEALVRVAALGRVLDRRIDAADVTEEVVDLDLRLRHARALGKRLTELLAEAKTVEETLKVETELARVRTEIERLEGRLQFLRDRVAWSTLVLRFVPVTDAPSRPQALPFPWLRDLGLDRLLGLAGGVR